MKQERGNRKGGGKRYLYPWVLRQGAATEGFFFSVVGRKTAIKKRKKIQESWERPREGPRMPRFLGARFPDAV